MGVKAFFCQSLYFTVEMAIYLKDAHGWNICSFTGKPKVEKIIRKEFPDALFHDTTLLKRNIFSQESSYIPKAPFDKHLMAALSYYESIAMKMMNRLDYNGKFSHQKRLLYYHSQVMFWKGLLDYLKPDIVVFREEPHQHDVRPYGELLASSRASAKLSTL
jgi:hypothetical protein